MFFVSAAEARFIRNVATGEPVSKSGPWEELPVRTGQLLMAQVYKAKEMVPDLAILGQCEKHGVQVLWDVIHACARLLGNSVFTCWCSCVLPHATSSWRVLDADDECSVYVIVTYSVISLTVTVWKR